MPQEKEIKLKPEQNRALAEERLIETGAKLYRERYHETNDVFDGPDRILGRKKIFSAGVNAATSQIRSGLSKVQKTATAKSKKSQNLISTIWRRKNPGISRTLLRYSLKT